MKESAVKGPDVLEEISKFIFTSKYARYREDLGRRETWDEAVERVRDMHLSKFSLLSDEDQAEIYWAFSLVKQKRVVPSMRMMQFAGPAIDAHNARGYNCSVCHVDNVKRFSEIFYLLMCGCGVGLGLTKKYVNKLPKLAISYDVQEASFIYTIEDSIEGWADSIDVLVSSYFRYNRYSGLRPMFDYSKIRDKGARLVTGGGRAPGPDPLRIAHERIRALMDQIVMETDKIRPIHVYDVIMHFADAVLSGGVRRSATSVMFDKDDEEMLHAKTGNWFNENPQRARSNNSVLLIRNKTSEEEFNSIVQRTREWGEPGFVWADNEDVLYNPCFEVGFIPVTKDSRTGVQFCNLSSINGSKINTPEQFLEAVRAATIIGTLQATYTDFPYLSKEAKELTEEEALLGVSITAIMDSPNIAMNPTWQRTGAKLVKVVNKEWAKKLNINPAARLSVIKPEGTSTLALGSMASGIHASHAEKMFRRIQMNKIDPVYNFFKQFNSHMCEESIWNSHGTDDVVTFPIKIKDGALIKSDIDALTHLDIIKSTQKNWVLAGTSEFNTKQVHHNVSCTVLIKDDEWLDVINYIFKNREFFTAVSLLSVTGDKDYAQAPMEAVVTDEDIEKFNYYINNLIPLDYSYMKESFDATEHQSEASCAGGRCEVV